MNIDLFQLQEELKVFKRFIQRDCKFDSALKVKVPCLFDYNENGGNLELEYGIETDTYSLVIPDKLDVKSILIEYEENKHNDELLRLGGYEDAIDDFISKNVF